MFETLRDKMTHAGLIVVTIGVALLIFTFASSYVFLSQSLSILAGSDLAQTFGEALAPLISTCIRVMYLGVMGWVGSLLTIRGVTILSQARQTSTIRIDEQPAAKETTDERIKEEVKEELQKVPQKVEERPKEEIKKPEAKPYEPEIVAITPETISQAQQEPQQPQQQPRTENK